MASRAARALAPALRPCCSCAPPRPHKVARLAYSTRTPPSFDDQVLDAARKTLDDAHTTLEQGSVEAAKRNRELDGLRRALTDVEEGQEVRFLSPSRSCMPGRLSWLSSSCQRS